MRDYIDGELADYERERGITPSGRLTRADLEPVWRRSRELGFYGIHLPAEYGGQGLDHTRLAALKEELGASGRVLASSVLGDMGGPLRAGDILRHATRHQLDTYLLPLIRGERACCFSLTEADAGSDVRSMSTVAVRDGDAYRLTGHKVFSSAGPFADFAIVVARMAGEDEPTDGKPRFSAFLVDLDSPGCRVEDGAVPMSGEHIESDIVLDDCRVRPPTCSARRARACASRSAGSPPTGCCTAPPSSAPPAGHSTSHWTGPAPASSRRAGPALLQAIQHKVADMATELYAARSMTYAALAALDQGREVHTEAFMCKLFVAESAFRILDEAVQIHGKEGLTQGHEIEFLFRKIRMFRVLTGTSEIQRNGIARALAFQH
ncbi:acyl-CoA dehydrogenase family protein [Streptomyces zhihengii]